MNIRKFLVFALTGLTLAACSNDDVVDNGTPVTGEETWAAFTIQLPKTTETRAADPNATTAETVVKKVAVYVMDAAGFIATSGVVDVADYGTVDGATNTIKATKVAVKTSAGEKKIWVVLNPTDAMHTQITGTVGLGGMQTAMTTAVTGMTGGYQYATETVADAKGFVMANKEILTKTLAANISLADALNSGNTDDAKNHFSVSVERAVAKVAAVAKAGGIENKLPLIGTFSDYKYYVRQVNPATYIARWTDKTKQPGGYNILTPGNDDDGTNIPWGNTAMAGNDALDINSNGTANNALNGIYVLENSMLDPMQQNATYMVIQTKWTPKKVYQADGVTEGTLNADGDFWFKDKKYYMEAPAGLSAVEADKVKWAKGICYYRTYLYDKYTNNMPAAGGARYYDVVRNTCYNVTINSTMAPGSNTDTPPGPGPDPIEEDTWVSVNVDILPWTFSKMDPVDLQ